jgi:KaiC/GvpD/RAD55 family RecA-like ATPase
LDDALPDGLPSPCAVLILADPGAGKEFLTTEMLSAHLGKGHQVLWVSLENFAETLRDMVDSVSIATQNNPWNGRLAFVDCYSSQIGVKSRERYSADPNNLPNLSIVTSVAISETSKETRLLVVLDSLSSLIQKVGVRPATEFFRMLVAKTRSLNADFLATLNRKAFTSETLALFQEITDCVIELTVRENHTDIDHYLRICKMLRRKYNSNWIPYQIDSEHCVLRKMHEDIAPPSSVDHKSITRNGFRCENSLSDEPPTLDASDIGVTGSHKKLDEMFDPYGKTASLQESERLAAIGQTVAMIGHDLRNPLQIMVNKIYLAKKEAESSPNELPYEFFMELEEQIEHMNGIIASLQDYSRFEPVFSETEPKQLVEKALATLTIPENIELLVEVSADIPKVMADQRMMKKALANIIKNAIQAMPEGGKLIIRSAKVGGALSIIIQDTGIGIARENLARIFSPLYTTKVDSTGIGLTISKRFVESHNGTIEVESEIGKGSIFTVKLPLR